MLFITVFDLLNYNMVIRYIIYQLQFPKEHCELKWWFTVNFIGDVMAWNKRLMDERIRELEVDNMHVEDEDIC